MCFLTYNTTRIQPAQKALIDGNVTRVEFFYLYFSAK